MRVRRSFNHSHCWLHLLIMDSLINESSDAVCYINSLPEDVLKILFSYLPQYELAQCAQVCRNWNAVAKEMRIPLLWKDVKVVFYGHLRSQTETANNFIEKLPPCVTQINLKFSLNSEWTESLNFKEFSARLQSLCPELQMLGLHFVIFSDNLITIVDLCTQFLVNVRNLTLRCPKFRVHSETVKCSDISKIEILNVYDRRLTKNNKPPFPKMPYLKELRLSNTFAKSSWFEINLPFFDKLEVLHLRNSLIDSGAFQTLRNYAHNLKELHVCCTHLGDNDLSFHNSMFPNLKTICFDNCRYVTCKGVASLILSCQSLQNIFVAKEVASSCEAHVFFIENNFALEKIKVIDICPALKMWM